MNEREFQHLLVSYYELQSAQTKASKAIFLLCVMTIMMAFVAIIIINIVADDVVAHADNG